MRSDPRHLSADAPALHGAARDRSRAWLRYALGTLRLPACRPWTRSASERLRRPRICPWACGKQQRQTAFVLRIRIGSILRQVLRSFTSTDGPRTSQGLRNTSLIRVIVSSSNSSMASPIDSRNLSRPNSSSSLRSAVFITTAPATAPTAAPTAAPITLPTGPPAAPAARPVPAPAAAPAKRPRIRRATVRGTASRRAADALFINPFAARRATTLEPITRPTAAPKAAPPALPQSLVSNGILSAANARASSEAESSFDVSSGMPSSTSIARASISPSRSSRKRIIIVSHMIQNGQLCFNPRERISFHHILEHSLSHLLLVTSLDRSDKPKYLRRHTIVPIQESWDVVPHLIEGHSKFRLN